MEERVNDEKKTRGNKEKLTLEAIADLGGNKEDLQLLNGIEDNSDSELEDFNDDYDAEPIKKDEIRQFLKELDIFKHRPKEGSEDEEKKVKKKDKIVDNSSVAEEESSVELKETELPSAAPQPEEKKKKKRQKNKFKVQHDEVSSTTTDPVTELLSHIKSYQPRKYLLVKAGGEALDNQEVEPSERENLPESVVKQIEEFASRILRDEVAIYTKQKENAKKSTMGWMKTVLSSGAVGDKMAALTVLVQESPFHGLQHIETLIGMAKKKGKRECIMATDTLKDLFLTEIIPTDRKLKYFNQRPLLSVSQAAGANRDAIDRKLLMWYFESQLKHKYADFVQTLQMMAHDNLPATKQKSIGIVYQLLVKKPEQEKVLLSMLINKVGDPDYKLASKVSHSLTNLVEEHPSMKSVVIREVEQLLFRPNIRARAQYYSVCFLNQLSLSHFEKDLAGQLIRIYFSFFKAYVKKGEVDSKMMSALLSGVNRAFPYAKLDPEFLDNEMENLYRLVHLVNFNTSIQALMLLYQVMDTSENVSERFYVALYKKLSDPSLKTASKQAMFLNLLFKSMKKDMSERRVKAFIKRLLQVCCFQQSQFTCGALILLSEILKHRPGLLALSHVEEDSDEEEHFIDLHNPESDTENENKSDGEDITDDKADDDEKPSDVQGKPTNKQGHSWLHRANMNHKSETNNYDPYHRNPLYSHAENSCVWELQKLANHFHPTVSLFAKQILKGESVSYTGDPLQDFTLIRFLDRFVYKNPKKVEEVKEKLATIPCHQSKPSGIKSIPVNSEQFINLEENKIPVDDRFYHRYFTQKAARMRKEGRFSDEDSDAESVDDNEFDEFLDKYEEHKDDGDFGDIHLDFAEEFGKKKGKRKADDDSDISDDEDLDDNLSDEEVEFSDDEVAMGKFVDADAYAEVMDTGLDDIEDVGEGIEDTGPRLGFDEEDIEFSDDDELQELAPKTKKGTKRKGKEPAGFMHQSKKGRKSSQGLLSAADELSEVIDENVGSKIDSIGAEALANKDKADVKQLKWEAERDRWLHGKNDWRSKRGKKFNRKQGHFKTKGRPFSGKGKGKKK